MKPLRVLVPGWSPPEGAPEGAAEVRIEGVTCDSREVEPGFLFAAWRGTKEDGSVYVSEALSRGCAAVLAERDLPTGPEVPCVVVPDVRRAFAEIAARFHGDPTARLNVVGVTGTNGKTTTTYLVRSILEAAGERAGLIGTVEYDTRRGSRPACGTTPAPHKLQALLGEMAGAGCRSAVMEVSSHALDQGRVHGVRFAAGILTNLTRDHLDYHGTMKAYLEAKRKLFEMLPPHGVAVLNAADPASPAFARSTAARVVRFGLNRRVPVSGAIQSESLDGVDFILKLGEERLWVHSRLIGAHNVANMLGAAAAAWGMGYDLEPIKHGLETVTQISGRLERVDEGDGPVVLVDYAHTDDALRNVLSALRPLVPGRLILVFGCGGDRDRDKRPKMGAVAEELADLFFVTSDNPRSEDPMDIIREIEGGIRQRSKYAVDPDRATAIRKAVALAAEGDAVLIAGKGHERTQESRGGTVPFDDREAARSALLHRARRGR